jgi:hypothetical protein
VTTGSNLYIQSTKAWLVITTMIHAAGNKIQLHHATQVRRNGNRATVCTHEVHMLILLMFMSVWALHILYSSRNIVFLSNPATRHGGIWGERRYSSYPFWTSALDGGEWSASRLGRAFTPGERTHGTHCTGGSVGHRAGLDTEATGKILCPRRESNPAQILLGRSNQVK